MMVFIVLIDIVLRRVINYGFHSEIVERLLNPMTHQSGIFSKLISFNQLEGMRSVALNRIQRIPFSEGAFLYCILHTIYYILTVELHETRRCKTYIQDIPFPTSLM